MCYIQTLSEEREPAFSHGVEAIIAQALSQGFECIEFDTEAPIISHIEIYEDIDGDRLSFSALCEEAGLELEHVDAIEFAGVIEIDIDGEKSYERSDNNSQNCPLFSIYFHVDDMGATCVHDFEQHL